MRPRTSSAAAVSVTHRRPSCWRSCVTPRPSPMPEAPARLELDGATLAYRQSGAGPDIVWLAAGDNPGDNWRRYQTPAFDDAYRSTTSDARGGGETRSATDPPWPIDEHAVDLAALIEAVCAPPVFLVGLSMGSLIAVQ